MTPVLILVTLVLGAVLLVGYGLFRTGGTGHRDTLAGVRVHGFITALAALFFTGFTGFEELGARTRNTSGGAPTEWAGGWMTVPAELDPSWAAPALALLPPVMVALIYTITQLTFPAPRGQVRLASLTPRAAGRILPTRLTALAALITALLGAMVILLAREPGTPEVAPSAGQGEAASGHLLPHALAGGDEIVLWIVLGFAATVGAIVVGLMTISRRRSLEKLSPAEDHAARLVAANRLLRTGVWMLWALVDGTWGAFTASRAARDRLAEVVPAHPAALPLEPSLGWISSVDVVGIVASLLLAVVLLLWRSPALHTLRPAGWSPSTEARTDVGPAEATRA